MDQLDKMIAAKRIEVRRLDGEIAKLRESIVRLEGEISGIVDAKSVIDRAAAVQGWGWPPPT